jgi:hypothetical protein
MILEVEPDFGGPLEVATEAKGGVGGDGAFAFDDLIDTAWGNSNVFGDTVFGQPKRQEEIFAENFSGVNGGVLFHGVWRVNGSQKFQRRAGRPIPIGNKFATGR